MNFNRKPYLVPALGILLGIAVIFLAAPIQKWSTILIAKFSQNKNANTTKALGTVVKVEGHVYRKGHQDSDFKKLPVGTRSQQPIFQLDSFQVAKHARLVIRMNSGYELKLLPKSLVVFELWDPADAKSPAYINFIYGNYKNIHNGTIGKLYIVREDSFYVPQYPPRKKAVVLQIDAQKSNQTIESVLEDHSEFIADNGVKKNPYRPNSSAITKVDPSGTLANEYIDFKITRQKKHFRQCRLNAMRTYKTIAGKMLVGFTILNSGKVANIRIFQNSIKVKKFNRCITTVFQRMKFKSYKGNPILRSVPLSFGLKQKT